MHKHLSILILCLALFSCGKDDLKQQQPPISQIDYIVIAQNLFNITDTIRDIRYDTEGRLTHFEDESYVYNTKGKVSRVNIAIDETEANIPNSIKQYYCDLTYDNKNRLINFSDVQFDRPTTGDLTIAVAFPQRNYTLNYINDATIPSSMEQSAYSSYSFGINNALVPKTVLSQSSTFENDSRNITKSTTTIKGRQYGAWTPPGDDDIEYSTEVTATYDNRNNVYKYLFGSLGFIPQGFMRRVNLQRAFIYSENNVLSLHHDNNDIAYSYQFDNRGRVIQINAINLKTIKIFYK